ncbi:major facilitator superfamily domain-containing protein [Exophiala viscosa]|uniref:Major facilitator superfamily domain-containing protein n=1 Tax=Exophiala viscosa TaxID=2486360 RepID=A0AAN6IEB0_9EURO|nr:major facilitator superfamily domain-containing protein [Exophiala viscosa]
MGIAVGGRFLREQEDSAPCAHEPSRETIRIAADLALTCTEITHNKDGREIILLSFASGDPENPFNWNVHRRRFISALLCLMTLFVGLATTAFSSGIDRMCKDLNVSRELGQLGLFTFNITCAIAPLFLAPFCELAGRRVVYVGAYFCFTLMFVGLALGRNIATILVCRALLGLFGSVGTILVGGTFSDMYSAEEMARPMALFSFVAILGTVAAPIYAGFIDEAIGWRWLEGIQGLSNIPLLIFVTLGLPETRGGLVLRKRAMTLATATGVHSFVSHMDLEAKSVKALLHESSVKAIHMLITEPVVLVFGLWIGFAWFITFLFLSVIPITFQDKRGWNEGIAGLPYISLCVGTTVGYLANFLQIRHWTRIKSTHSRRVVPEDRLYGVLYGGSLLPVGLFMYSFTQYRGLTWVGPTLSLAPIATGIFFIFESCYSYTADCYGEDNAGSALAGQSFLRNTMGAVAPLFAAQFFHNVGSQYAGLILALVSSAMACIPYLMFKYGPVLRQRSSLALHD